MRLGRGRARFVYFYYGIVFLISCFTVLTSDCIDITVDTSEAPDLYHFGKKVASTLQDWFPRVEEILRSPGYKGVSKIKIFFDPDYKRVACTKSGGLIIASVDYYENHQDDLGSMIHEMVHVIQGYNTNKCDWWVTEGIADWVRYYHYEPNSDRKPRMTGDKYYHYTQGYGVAAYFLNHLSLKHGSIIYWINNDCREGTFDLGLFYRVTGKSVEEHWKDMMR